MDTNPLPQPQSSKCKSWARSEDGLKRDGCWGDTGQQVPVYRRSMCTAGPCPKQVHVHSGSLLTLAGAGGNYAWSSGACDRHQPLPQPRTCPSGAPRLVAKGHRRLLEPWGCMDGAMGLPHYGAPGCVGPGPWGSVPEDELWGSQGVQRAWAGTMPWGDLSSGEEEPEPWGDPRVSGGAGVGHRAGCGPGTAPGSQ